MEVGGGNILSGINAKAGADIMAESRDFNALFVYAKWVERGSILICSVRVLSFEYHFNIKSICTHHGIL